MKKVILLSILAVFVFTLISCSGKGAGKGHVPETEPPVTVPDQKEEEKIMEEQGQKQVQQDQHAEAPVEQEQEKPQDTKPLEEEVIPVIKIEAEKKPPKAEDEVLETPEIKKITGSISTGIIDIFKGFGYSGDIRVPENFNKRVAYYIRYFSSDKKGARFYLRAMSRGSEYLPMIRQVFKEKHLPQSLAYLPLIESGYNPTARSRAGAVGMWQFMKGTARMYGLSVTRYKDERKDPVKSTAAAAEYLDDLLAMFGVEDPFLGICAFNAGEGKILNALRKISYKERSFWTLVNKNLLRYETNEYIPRLLAIILMARDPVRYTAASNEASPETDEGEDQEILSSFHRAETKDNLGEEKTEAPRKEEIDIKTVEEKSLQPPQTTQPTQTTQTTQTTRTVSGPGQTVSEEPPVTTYDVKAGDTLYSIARLYGVGVTTLKKWNSLRGSRIHPGQKLKIYAAAPAPAAGKSVKQPAGQRYKLVYTVNYTDSLIRIALFFDGVSARDIMKWNRLRRTRIYPRQKLAIYLEKPPAKVLTHVVKRGENANSISRQYGVRVEYVLSLNGLLTDSRLKPGMRLKIYYF
jgi:membrane-bound lytic murein transglycosylase D